MGGRRSAWSRYSWAEVRDLARALQVESRSRRALSEEAQNFRDWPAAEEPAEDPVEDPIEELKQESRITRVERIREQRAQRHLSASRDHASDCTGRARVDFDSARFKEAWRASRSPDHRSQFGARVFTHQDAAHQDATHHGAHEMSSHDQRSEAQHRSSSLTPIRDPEPSGWDLLRDHFLAQRQRRLEADRTMTLPVDQAVEGQPKPIDE